MPDLDPAGKSAPAAGQSPAGASLLFLREEQIRQAQDMLFLAGRDFAASVDPVLEEAGSAAPTTGHCISSAGLRA